MADVSYCTSRLRLQALGDSSYNGIYIAIASSIAIRIFIPSEHDLLTIIL